MLPAYPMSVSQTAVRIPRDSISGGEAVSKLSRTTPSQIFCAKSTMRHTSVVVAASLAFFRFPMLISFQ